MALSYRNPPRVSSQRGGRAWWFRKLCSGSIFCNKQFSPTKVIRYIIPQQSNSELPRKATPQPGLNKCKPRVTACTNPCPGTANPNLSPESLWDLGQVLAWGSFPRASSWLPPDSPLQAHVSSVLLALPSSSSSSSSLPVLTVTSFWSCAFLFSPSPLLSPSVRKLKIILPFFAAGFPV